MNSYLEVKNITKYFKGTVGPKQLILEKMSFSVNEEHSITSILTPFGGGKTTLLKILSGLDSDYSGDIFLNGKKIKNKLPFIPEKPASFPWLTVSGNLKAIMKICEKEKRFSNTNIQELIYLTGLTGYEDHYPDNKSYGFRFRISLARAMVVVPQIILLDDPFKLMDSETKEEIYELIKKIASVQKIKFILASSNITDVVLHSDRILFIKSKPGYVSGEIIVDHYKRKSEMYNIEIQDILRGENVLSSSNYSI